MEEKYITKEYFNGAVHNLRRDLLGEFEMLTEKSERSLLKKFEMLTEKSERSLLKKFERHTGALAENFKNEMKIYGDMFLSHERKLNKHDKKFEALNL